jgi:hypothetical protein
MKPLDHSGVDEFDAALCNYTALLVEECTVKYGDQFGRLLVSAAARKYGRFFSGTAYNSLQTVTRCI